MGTVPVVALGLGSVAGLGAARLAASHYSVMVKEMSAVFVAGPPVVERLGEPRTKQELGGWEVQLACGAVDHAVDTEDEAFEAARRFLSYLPSSIWDVPPRVRGWDDPERRDEFLISAIPRVKKQAYHMRRIIEALVDKGSFFEMGAAVRPLDHHRVLPARRLAGGADGRRSAVRTAARGPRMPATRSSASSTWRRPSTCRSCIWWIARASRSGCAAESSAVIRWGVRALSAINQTTVPWCSIVVRNCYGVGGLGHQPVSHLCVRYAWPSASWGSLPLEGGIEAAYRAEIDAAPRPAGEDGRDRGAAEPAALAVPHRRAVLGGGGDRSARHAAAAVRVRQHGGAAADAGGVAVHHAAVGWQACSEHRGHW